jgi:hypothetical protein
MTRRAIAYLVIGEYLQPVLDCHHKYRLVKKMQPQYYCHSCAKVMADKKSKVTARRKYDKRIRQFFSQIGAPVANKRTTH